MVRKHILNALTKLFLASRLQTTLFLIVAWLGMSLLGTNMANAEWKISPGQLVPQSADVVLPAKDGKKQKQLDIPLLLYVPQEYGQDKQQNWPFVLFLHGLGECGNGGDDMELVKIHAIPKLIAQGKQFPFVVVAPQCTMPARGRYRGAWKADQLLALLDQANANLQIDKSRVYVTGLSMGGFGTWRLAAAAPNRFAAAIPVCGGGDPDWAGQLKQVPIWCFHGAKDNVVPVSESQAMVEAIRSAGGNVQLTIYPEAGHNAWDATYDNAEIYTWLLSKRRE